MVYNSFDIIYYYQSRKKNWLALTPLPTSLSPHSLHNDHHLRGRLKLRLNSFRPVSFVHRPFYTYIGYPFALFTLPLLSSSSADKSWSFSLLKVFLKDHSQCNRQVGLLYTSFMETLSLSPLSFFRLILDSPRAVNVRALSAILYYLHCSLSPSIPYG